MPKLRQGTDIRGALSLNEYFDQVDKGLFAVWGSGMGVRGGEKAHGEV
jgi:hypothetical protein